MDQARQPLIALVVPSIGYGGAEAVNLVLAKEFMNQNYRVDFVTAWEVSASKFFFPKGARHLNLKASRTRGMIAPLTRYLRTESPDATLVSLWPLTTACVMARQLARSPTRLAVIHHNMLSIQYKRFDFLQRALMRLSLAYEFRGADIKIGVSSGVADDLAALSRLPRNAFSVVHNPLRERPEVTISDAQVEAIWGGWRGPRILTVGIMKAQKNHELLIRAFDELLKERDARLLILGSGEMAEATSALVRARGLSDKVIMPGLMPDVFPFYRSADLFVLSSNYEGFGNVIVEALSCGLPVVSTDCKSGPSEILDGGRYGRLVPVGDAASLTRAMLDSLNATTDRQALIGRARDFAPERIGDRYLRLLFPEVFERGEACNRQPGHSAEDASEYLDTRSRKN